MSTIIFLVFDKFDCTGFEIVYIILTRLEDIAVAGNPRSFMFDTPIYSPLKDIGPI